jgi:hypothetical protein
MARHLSQSVNERPAARYHATKAGRDATPAQHRLMGATNPDDAVLMRRFPSIVADVSG